MTFRLTLDIEADRPMDIIQKLLRVVSLIHDAHVFESSIVPAATAAQMADRELGALGAVFKVVPRG